VAFFGSETASYKIYICLVAMLLMAID